MVTSTNEDDSLLRISQMGLQNEKDTDSHEASSGGGSVLVGLNNNNHVSHHKGIDRLDSSSTDESRSLIAHAAEDTGLASKLQEVLQLQNIGTSLFNTTDETVSACMYLKLAQRCELLIVVISNAFVHSQQHRMIYMLIPEITKDVCKVFAITVDPELSHYWMSGFPHPLERVRCRGDVENSVNSLAEAILKRQKAGQHVGVDSRQIEGGSDRFDQNTKNSKNVQVGPNQMDIRYHDDVYVLQVDPGPVIKVLNIGDHVAIGGEIGKKRFIFKLKVSTRNPKTCKAVEEQMMKDLTMQCSPNLPKLDRLFSRSESIRIAEVRPGCIEFELVSNDAAAVERFKEKLLSGEMLKELTDILVTENVKRVANGADLGLTVKVVRQVDEGEADQGEPEMITSCPKHPSEKVTSFCDDCKELVCNECLANHTEHAVVSTGTGAQRADKHTRQIVESLNAQQKAIEEALGLARNVLDRKSSIEKLQEYVRYRKREKELPLPWQGRRERPDAAGLQGAHAAASEMDEDAIIEETVD